MSVAEQDWMSLTDAETALQFSELCVLAVEAVAAGWTPDQCRIAAVSINGKRTLSLICSLE